jgi:hypothetical protein
MLPGAVARSRTTVLLVAAVLLPPVLAFVLMFPLPEALGFLAVGLTLSLATGRAVGRPPGTGPLAH